MANDRLLNGETAVLGSILIDPEICGEVFSKVHENDFITSEYKHIFLSAKKLYLQNKHIDAVTICHEAGGDAYRDLLMQLMQVTPTSAGWYEYAEVLKQESRLYKLQQIGAKMMTCSSLDEASKILNEAHSLTSSRADIKTINMTQGLMNFMQDLESKPEYILTSIGKLDQKLNISSGDFIIIGGYPSAGKTALALQIASYMGIKKKVGIFSLETNDRKIYNRLISQLTLTDFRKIKTHNLSEKELLNIAKQNKMLCDIKLEVVNASGMTTNDIISKTYERRYDIIFIDYLQLITANSIKENRTEQVSQISRNLHTFAQDSNTTVIALSQLNRPEKENKVQKAPTMASLRESGQIEQDADAIMLLYLSDPENPYSDRVLKLVKNKDGELGYMLLNFDGRHQTFLEYMDEKNTKVQEYRSLQQKIAGA